MKVPIIFLINAGYSEPRAGDVFGPHSVRISLCDWLSLLQNEMVHP